MKKFISLITLMTLSSVAIAIDYIIVSVSGLRTIRDKSQTLNVLERKIDPSGEGSSVWRLAPTEKDNVHIRENAYLTHFSTPQEINKTIALFVNKQGVCDENTEMILMVNSWGAKTSQKVARLFREKCHKLPIITYMIEAISKPTFFSYTKDVLSEKCVNIYQKTSKLHGNKISNCYNYMFPYTGVENTLYDSHIEAEWDGSILVNKAILSYINDQNNIFNINQDDNQSSPIISTDYINDFEEGPELLE